jgi:hypothetical protein
VLEISKTGTSEKKDDKQGSKQEKQQKRKQTDKTNCLFDLC